MVLDIMQDIFYFFFLIRLSTLINSVKNIIAEQNVRTSNSDLHHISEGIKILHPTDTHTIWAVISDEKLWTQTLIRRLIIYDSASIIQNGVLIGTIAYWDGNITGTLINHWTGQLITLRATAYTTDSIDFVCM